MENLADQYAQSPLERASSIIELLGMPKCVNRFTHSIAPFVLLVANLLLLVHVIFAQGETTSAIVGQVTDPTNAVVPGATLTIRNTETGLKRSANTDDTGRFNFPQLKPGIYIV